MLADQRNCLRFMLERTGLQLAGQLLMWTFLYCLEFMEGVFEGCMGALALSIDNRKVAAHWAMIGARRGK